MSGSKSGTAALAFTIANFGGAALNYLFQVHAAAVLDAAAFGVLSAWLARITLAGVVATVVQYVSLDFRLADEKWEKSARVVGALALAVFAAHVALGAQLPLLVLSTSAVLGGIVLYAFVGQLQARLQLGVIALSILAAALSRFLLPFGWAREARAPAFFVAHAASSFAGIVAIAAIVMFAPGQRVRGGAALAAPTAAPHKTQQGLRLRRPILLASAASLFPLLDILVVSATQDAATTGAFSRVALAARIVFFCGAAALQILLPYELHAAEHGTKLPSFALQLRRWLTPAMVLLAVVLAFTLDRFVLHARGEEQTWLRASCISFALLVAILGHVNRFAAHDHLGIAAGLVAGVVIASGAAAALAALAGTMPVARYVVSAVTGETVVLLAAIALQLRTAPKAPAPGN